MYRLFVLYVLVSSSTTTSERNPCFFLKLAPSGLLSSTRRKGVAPQRGYSEYATRALKTQARVCIRCVHVLYISLYMICMRFVHMFCISLCLYSLYTICTCCISLYMICIRFVHVLYISAKARAGRRPCPCPCPTH